MSENEAVRTVAVSHPNGLCLRGASSICELARLFQARLELVKGEQRASATEALEVALLAAEYGSQLMLRANGPDAEEAVDALAALFRNNFGLEE